MFIVNSETRTNGKFGVFRKGRIHYYQLIKQLKINHESHWLM